MEDLISKKNLLLTTGISYGQLYRWKRKGLIPESWFIRRSTFTGQETFFPRDAILERIRWIQSMKNDAALDALAEQIRHPIREDAALPQDIVWSLAELPAPNESVRVTCFDLFYQLVFKKWLPDRSYAVKEQLSEFLAKVPSEWLEHPDVVLWGEDCGYHWRWMVAKSCEDVWFGVREPRLRVPLAPVWRQAKEIWDEATRRVQGTADERSKR